MLIGTPHTADTVQKVVRAWIFKVFHQLQMPLTFRILVRLQSFWYLFCLARAETSKNGIYNSKIYDLPTLPRVTLKRFSSKYGLASPGQMCTTPTCIIAHIFLKLPGFEIFSGCSKYILYIFEKSIFFLRENTKNIFQHPK